MADIYKQKQWELDSAIDDLYAVASRYEDYKNEVNRFIDCVIDDEIAYRDERDKLQKRIEKAIEYIEKNWIEYSDFQYVDNDDELNIDCESIKELLDILKGSDKSE